MKIKLNKETAQEIVAGWAEGWEQVEEAVVDTSRWSIHYEAIHKRESDGKHFLFHFSRGATEQQYESPYEYDGAEIEVSEVRPVKRIVRAWEEVSDGTTEA